MRPEGTKEQLEARRKNAVEMVKNGMLVSEVAELVGVHAGSVSRWMQMSEQDEEKGLNSKKHPGGKPRLANTNWEKIAELLLQGPGHHGYHTELWTLQRVAVVIQKHFGIKYHPATVWRLLQKMGWSCQKPERIAREQNQEAVRIWRTETWPEIKKGRETKTAA
jgi:transposase